MHLVFWNGLFAKFPRMTTFADAVPWFATLVVVNIVDVGDFCMHAVFTIVKVVSALSKLQVQRQDETKRQGGERDKRRAAS